MNASVKSRRRHPDIDPRFLFVHWGFNVRPMEIQAAMASIQLTRLENLNQNRRANFRTMKAALASHRHIFSLPVASPNVDPAWFGLILVLNAPYAHQRAALFKHLGQHGVETRPVISGNFARQPVCNPTIDTWTAACGINAASSFPNTDVIHSRGLYIGLPSASTLTPAQTEELRTAITSFPFSERHVTLVTGANGVVGTALRSMVSAVVPTAAQRSSLAFVFVNRTHADLRNASAVKQLLFDVRPTKIIHLAAKIAPMSTMQRAPTEFFKDNVKINQNVLRGAEKLLQSGLLGGHLQTLDVVSCLSTAMLPDSIGIDMPVNETTVMKLIAADEVKGMLGYPAAKWAQLKLSMAVAKKSPRLRAVTVLPSNIFGPGAKCDASGPLLNAIIAKAVAAKAHKSPLDLAGTGQPLRHMLFSEDLAQVLLWALDYYHDSSSPLIVARNEVRVRDLARMAASAVGFSGKITFDHKSPDGPLRRAVSTTKLDAHLMGYPLIWTPLNAAIEATASSCMMGNRQLSERAEEPNKHCPALTICTGTIPGREAGLSKVLQSLATQNYCGSVEISLQAARFNDTQRARQKLLNAVAVVAQKANTHPITVSWVEDLGPGTKVWGCFAKVPVSQHFVIADDDEVRPPGFLSQLVAMSAKLDNTAVGYSGYGDPAYKNTFNCPYSQIMVDNGRNGGLRLVKLVSDKVSHRPCRAWWPQSYMGYLIPPRPPSSITFADHFDEVAKLFTPEEMAIQKLPKMVRNVTANDDAVVGAYLYRIGLPYYIVGLPPQANFSSIKMRTWRVDSYSLHAMRKQKKWGPAKSPIMITAQRLLPFWKRCFSALPDSGRLCA